TAIVFSPTALLGEKLPSDIPHPNAIRIGTNSAETASAGALCTEKLPSQTPHAKVHIRTNSAESSSAGALCAEASDLIKGGEVLTQVHVRSVSQDLTSNRPSNST